MTLSPERIAFYVFILIIVLAVGFVLYKFLPRKVKHDEYVDKWKHLQSKLSDKDKWGEAVVEADDLLVEALKNKKIKGSSTGERMVSAQKIFSSNDGVWFGHKLRRKIEVSPDVKLKKEDVKKALVGIAQGLKDLGVLKKK